MQIASSDLASLLSPSLIGWLIVSVTVWAAGSAAIQKRTRGVLGFVQWALCFAAYVLAATWCVVVNQIPWPESRSIKMPDLLVGGASEFPVLFPLLVVFLTGMAFYCGWRAVDSVRDDSTSSPVREATRD